MIRSAIGSGIGAGALFFATSPALAAVPEAFGIDRLLSDRASPGPRLYASLLPRRHHRFGLTGGEDGLLHAGSGMIALAPFGEGFSLSARDRPDRGGARSWESLRAGSVRGMSFTGGLESLGGRKIVRKFAPALMFGYGKSPSRGLNFALEGGMLLRSRLLTAPIAGLARTSLPDIRGADRVQGTALLQARLGYRF